MQGVERSHARQWVTSIEFRREAFSSTMTGTYDWSVALSPARAGRAPRGAPSEHALGLTVGRVLFYGTRRHVSTHGMPWGQRPQNVCAGAWRPRFYTAPSRAVVTPLADHVPVQGRGACRATR